MKTTFKNAMKPVVLALTASTLLLGATTSVAKPSSDVEMKSERHMSEGKKSIRHELKKMKKSLNLTDEQLQEIKAIYKEQSGLANIDKSSMMQFKQDAEALIKADSFDESAYKSLFLANQAQFADKAVARAKMKHQVLQVLTAEQKEKWFTMKQSFKR